MSAAVHKFQGYYRQATAKKPSGCVDDDLIVNAETAYKMQTGIEFKFLECWRVLRTHPKFALIDEEKQPDSEDDKGASGATSPRSPGGKASKRSHCESRGESESDRKSARVTLGEVSEKA